MLSCRIPVGTSHSGSEEPGLWRRQTFCLSPPCFRFTLCLDFVHRLLAPTNSLTILGLQDTGSLSSIIDLRSYSFLFARHVYQTCLWFYFLFCYAAGCYVIDLPLFPATWLSLYITKCDRHTLTSNSLWSLQTPEIFL